MVENQRRAEARRRALAADFRARLLADLEARGIALGIGQDALVDAATSCYVEIQEVSQLFLRCKASGKQLTQLGLARGQLARTLRLLGLAHDPSSSVDAGQVTVGTASGNAPTAALPPKHATPEQLRQWSEGYVDRRAAGVDEDAAS